MTVDYHRIEGLLFRDLSVGWGEDYNAKSDIMIQSQSQESSMQMSLEIDNNFFPHFKAMIDSFAKDNKVSNIGIDRYDYGSCAPKSVIINSAAEIQKRVVMAEERVGNGEYVDTEEYEEQMDAFFTNELSLKR